jgi:hypothetical protein
VSEHLEQTYKIIKYILKFKSITILGKITNAEETQLTDDDTFRANNARSDDVDGRSVALSIAVS